MRSLAMVLAVAGCNPVFEIDTTQIAPADRDGDGIEDADDNCVEATNADQIETDGDALGDACDLCPGTLGDSNHDEDLDGVPDVCDVCPALDDFGLDFDADGIGDACEVDSAISRRRIFDPFVTLDRWQGAATWRTVDHAAAPSSPLAADDRGIALPELVLANDNFIATVAFTATERWTAGDRAAVSIEGVGDGLTSSCVLACTSEQDCTLSLVVEGIVEDSFSVAPTPYVTLSLWVLHLGVGDMREIFCEAPPISGVVYDNFDPVSSSWTPRVVASPIMQAAYFEALE